jgi:hypothetical protein
MTAATKIVLAVATGVTVISKEYRWMLSTLLAIGMSDHGCSPVALATTLLSLKIMHPVKKNNKTLLF